MNSTFAFAAAPALSSASPSSRSKWIARVSMGLAVAFLTFDTVIKVLQLAPAVQGTTQLGFAASDVLTIGLIELACLALYLVPRTAPIGAVLFTAYLGGAVATHLRLGDPVFSHVLSGVYVAVLLWLPLYLRDARVRGLVGRA